ncbi:MAG: PQQ-dependent sugar dehydrogenase, partial [Bacteroidota bacterium]
MPLFSTLPPWRYPWCLFLSLILWSSLSAQLPEDFFQEVVAEFQLPVGLTVDERGYTYVWEKGGIVWLLDSNEVKMPTPFLDLSEEVAEWRDHGLLGFVLDPDFLFNGYVYCAYTVDRHHLFHYGTPDYSPDSTVLNQATIGRITRFTADADRNFTVAPYETRKVLLGEDLQSGIPIPNNLHGVGSLAFGDDGSLLTSTGDGGPDFQAEFSGDFHIEQAIEEGILSAAEQVGPFRAQLLGGLNGKILRLDPLTGDGLPDNPYFDPAQPRKAASRVWTLGIRNPYRMATIPGSGSHDAGAANPGIIVFGDVGEGLWEEINFVTGPGQNCGWPIYEGLEENWKWAPTLRKNTTAPNPLAGATNCDRDYFYFQDLLLPANDEAKYFWRNPCDDQQLIPNGIPRFTHHWPVIEYNNQLFNQPTRARIAFFDDSGTKVISPLPALNNGIRGQNFDGFSAMAGFWYESGPLPEQYQRTFWMADYSGWIRYLSLDEDYRVTRVDTFTRFDHDIVGLTFNPQQQSIYFVDISEGRLYKIAY